VGASKRSQKPRKDRASPLGNERRRYGPIRRKKPRRWRPRRATPSHAVGNDGVTRIKAVRGRTSRGPRSRVTGEPTAGRGSSSRGGCVAGNAQVFGLSRRKRYEPHGRQRDATSPRAAARRKPSRWCETTRAERDSGIGIPGPKMGSLLPVREWTRSGDLARGLPPGRVDGGAKGRGAGASRFPWSNPMRGSRCEPGGAADERSEVEPKEGSMTGPAAMRGR
jgi:hypothetical protein